MKAIVQRRISRCHTYLLVLSTDDVDRCNLNHHQHAPFCPLLENNRTKAGAASFVSIKSPSVSSTAPLSFVPFPCSFLVILARHHLRKCQQPNESSKPYIGNESQRYFNGKNGKSATFPPIKSIR